MTKQDGPGRSDGIGVSREYAIKCEEAGNSGPEVKRLATEYAARLMLAGEGE